MPRIVIIGTSCSGKTTLAKKIEQLLDVKHIQLDELYWKPGWVEREYSEFKRLVQDAIVEDEWIADGNYSAVRDILWSRATTIIWLNYPFPLVLYRAISRTLKRSITQEVLFSGNVETFKTSFFSNESILLWVIKTHRLKQRAYSKLLSGNLVSEKEVVELRSQEETNKFIQKLTRLDPKPDTANTEILPG